MSSLGHALVLATTFFVLFCASVEGGDRGERKWGQGRQALSWVPLRGILTEGFTWKRRARLQICTGSRMTADSSGELLSSSRSSLNGNIQVRQLRSSNEKGEEIVRALWFDSSPQVWQSAMKMKRDTKLGEFQPDWNVLPFHSSKAFAFASALIQRDGSSVSFAEKILVIGLGGGTIVGWSLANMPGLKELQAVEADEIVVEMAKTFFALPVDDKRLKVAVANGNEFVHKLKDIGRSFDLIILDVGSPGIDGHCTAPPEEFLREENMKNLHEILENGGVLAFTMIGHSSETLLSHMKKMDHIFGGGVCFLENRDVSHSWLRTPASKVVYCVKETSKDQNSITSKTTTRSAMTERARMFDKLLPDGAKLDMAARVLREFNDLQSLETRVQQERIYASTNSGRATQKSEVAASDKSGWQERVKNFKQGNNQGSTSISLSQLEVFQKNHPQAAGVQELSRELGIGQENPKDLDVEKQRQMKIFMQNHRGVQRFDEQLQTGELYEDDVVDDSSKQSELEEIEKEILRARKPDTDDTAVSFLSLLPVDSNGDEGLKSDQAEPLTGGNVMKNTKDGTTPRALNVGDEVRILVRTVGLSRKLVEEGIQKDDLRGRVSDISEEDGDIFGVQVTFDKAEGTSFQHFFALDEVEKIHQPAPEPSKEGRRSETGMNVVLNLVLSSQETSIDELLPSLEETISSNTGVKGQQIGSGVMLEGEWDDVLQIAKRCCMLAKEASKVCHTRSVTVVRGTQGKVLFSMAIVNNPVP